MAYTRFDMIQKLDSWGVYFQKDETGEYDKKRFTTWVPMFCLCLKAQLRKFFS